MTIANKFARRLCTLLAACGLMLGTAQAQTVIYYHTDALGSPVATTDASGNVLERTEYEPYGQVLNPPVKDGPGYTGHVSDAQTGLSYMQQRYYDPQIGRFLSMDPVTADANTGGNFNRYWYANNNPYKFTDPDGRQTAIGLPPVRQEQMVPIPIIQKLQAAQNAAAPKTAYVSGSVASARGGGPGVSGSAEAGAVVVSVGTGGLDADANAGSARIDTIAGSVETSGKPTSGMAVGTGVSGPSGNVGVSNLTSANAIANFPKTKVVTPIISFAWGSDNKGHWLLEAGGGAKLQGAFERPKSDE